MICFWYEIIYFLKVKKKLIGTWSRDNKGRLLIANSEIAFF
jgi:hypothetical protein